MLSIHPRSLLPSTPARLGLLLAMAGLLTAFTAGCGTRDSMLIVLHTNDIHSWFAAYDGQLEGGEPARFGGAPVLAGLVRQFRADNPGQVLYLDAGDVFQGTPISTLTEGRACVEVLNLLAPDAFELGNHEFDYGMEAQRKALINATFPYLQGNVRMVGHAQPYCPSDLLINRNGLQVAVLGLNTDQLHRVCDPRLTSGFKVDSSQAVTRKWLTRVTADVKILLSHNGFEADSLLALAVPGIDLIVGGHSHTALAHPVKVGGTWIVQAGDKGRYLGVDTLWVKPGKGLQRCSGSLVPVLEGAAEPAADVAAVVEGHERLVNEQLGGQVAPLLGDWPSDAHNESALGNWLCAAIRQESGAQIGLWNSGGIRKGMAAGPLRVRDFWEISPFGNEILVVPMSGGQLRKFFVDEVARGSLHLHFDGLRVGVDEQGGVGSILVGTQPLATDKTFSVALSDYLWNQVRQPADSLVQPRYTGVIDRDMLIARARAEQQIQPLTDGRWGPGRSHDIP